MSIRTFGVYDDRSTLGRVAPRAAPPLCDARHRRSTMVLKTERCSFSGLRVYPGHGTRLTKIDSVRRVRMRCAVRVRRARWMTRGWIPLLVGEGRGDADDDDDDGDDACVRATMMGRCANAGRVRV